MPDVSRSARKILRQLARINRGMRRLAAERNLLSVVNHPKSIEERRVIKICRRARRKLAGVQL